MRTQDVIWRLPKNGYFVNSLSIAFIRASSSALACSGR